MPASRWILRIPGTLLLLAAGLKVQGLGVDPVSRMGFFSTAEAQLVVIGCEVFLGVWLWLAKSPLGSWLTSLVTFAAFAGVSFYQGWVGQTSCGCFGRLTINPWYTFGADLLVLALLVVGRPDLKQLRATPAQNLAVALRPLAWGILGVGVNLALLLVLASKTFGSLPAAIAFFRSDRVSAYPRLIAVGEGVSGDTRKVSVEVANWTDKPIRLIGGTRDCSCTVMGELPVTIPAGEVRIVTVDITLAEKPGIFTRTAAFLVDDGGIRHVSFRLTGRVLESKELADAGSGEK